MTALSEETAEDAGDNPDSSEPLEPEAPARRTLMAAAAATVLLILMSPLTAFAAAADKVKFSIKPKVAVKLISEAPGVRRYQVASNSPFRISVSGVIGPVKTTISRIGEAAQRPGPAKACRRVAGFLPATIYRAKRKTAAEPGKRKAQSVIVTVKYSKLAKPKFKILPRTSAPKSAPVAQRCDPVDSSNLSP